MRTYRELISHRQFRTLFVTRCTTMVAVSASSLALGTVTYDVTSSTVLTAFAMFGGPLFTLLGSATLLGANDTIRPRTAVLAQPTVITVVCAIQAVPGLPWPVRFVLLAIPYVVGAATSGSNNRMLLLVLPREAFALGRSTLNLAVGAMQVVGYGLGGLLLTRTDSTTLFAVAAGCAAVTVVVLRLGLDDHPAIRSGGARGVVGRTGAVNRLLLGSKVTLPIYLAAWVPNGLVAGVEGLFVPYAGAVGAGYLFAATAAGMLVGDVVVGRMVPERWRDRLLGPLRVLLALPYVGLLLDPPLVVALLLGFVASVGFAAMIPLQERLVARVDEAVQGQGFGLQSSGMMIGQAAGAVVGGAVATWLPVPLTMGVLALASLTVTAALVRPLRRSAPQ